MCPGNDICHLTKFDAVETPIDTTVRSPVNLAALKIMENNKRKEVSIL